MSNHCRRNRTYPLPAQYVGRQMHREPIPAGHPHSVPASMSPPDWPNHTHTRHNTATAKDGDDVICSSLCTYAGYPISEKRKGDKAESRGPGCAVDASYGGEYVRSRGVVLAATCRPSGRASRIHPSICIWFLVAVIMATPSRPRPAVSSFEKNCTHMQMQAAERRSERGHTKQLAPILP